MKSGGGRPPRDPVDPEPAVHEMVCEAETPDEMLFVCTDSACGRKVVLGKSVPGLTAVVRGDFSARHIGSHGGPAFGDVTIA
ncbi:hypothetical protein Ari01nite_96390 [Paractinoplanes rishiriensis]|uniref:Uncharacterized protein n=1 Tax=Paractinoplanes rishiriensis TaxID=1050105 RepID=A0A919N069_9ACTN|nr:hypothetical protein Ari01nite_96390 [Actinoplanes rishiriensis]